MSNRTSANDLSLNPLITRQDDAAPSADFVSRSTVNVGDTLAPVNPFCATVENDVLPTSVSNFLLPTSAIASPSLVHTSSSTGQSEVETRSLLPSMPPELLKQLSSVIMQFSPGFSHPAPSTQVSFLQNSAATDSLDEDRNQSTTTEQLTERTQVEASASFSGIQIEEEENLTNRSIENVDNSVNEESFEPHLSSQNETFAQSASNDSNVNRIIRSRDVRFEQVKANATQHNLASRVFRNQSSSYSVTSAKMKYNLNLNVDIRPFPKSRMLSPGEPPRKDNEGRNVEAFELPDLNHIPGIKVYGLIVSKFVPGKKSDPVIKEVSQRVYSKLFPYTGYYPCSTFLGNFTTILVERYCGLHDEQTATGNTLILNKIQQIYESARASRKNVLVANGLLEFS